MFVSEHTHSQREITMVSSLGAEAITESEFYDQLSDRHEKVLDMGAAAMHSDGKTILYESAQGHYAKVTSE